MTTIYIKDRSTYMTVMDESGEFHCPHDNAEVIYERGGDGITEPRGGHFVDCPDCQGEDLTQEQVDAIVENYLDREEDFDG